jgi:hypothetical protein
MVVVDHARLLLELGILQSLGRLPSRYVASRHVAARRGIQASCPVGSSIRSSQLFLLIVSQVVYNSLCTEFVDLMSMYNITVMLLMFPGGKSPMTD